MTDSDWYTFISHSPSFECYSRIISDDTVIEKYRIRQTGCLHYRAVLSNGELLSITYIPKEVEVEANSFEEAKQLAIERAFTIVKVNKEED